MTKRTVALAMAISSTAVHSIHCLVGKDQMLDGEHLTLKQVRLGSSKQWLLDQQGFVFLFPKGGAGKLQWAGKQEHLVIPEEVLVLSGLTGGKLCAGNGKEMVFWFFSLNLEHLYPLFGGQEISLLHHIADGFKGLKRFPMAHPVSARCHKLLAEVPPRFDLDHRSQLLRVVSVILTDEFNRASKQRASNGGAEDHLIQVFETLTAQDLLNLSVDDLAARFACSRRHLSRLFNHYLGFSVAALRMEMRLLMAVALLRDPSAKVISVADKCGFNHLGLFNNCFKKRYGVTPGQWRKNQNPVKPEPMANNHVFGILASKVMGPKNSNGMANGPVGVNSLTRNSARSNAA